MRTGHRGGWADVDFAADPGDAGTLPASDLGSAADFGARLDQWVLRVFGIRGDRQRYRKTPVARRGGTPSLSAVHHTRGRDRRPARRAAPPRPRDEPSAPLPVGRDAVLVGFFSAKQKDFAALMDAAAADLTAHGVRVVGRIVQRRGVSHGGAAKMSLPLSPQTLLGYGKAREAAAACERTGADAAVFLRPLTDRQRRTLTALLGCPAVTLAEALTRDRSD
ncbi:hypothetical protein OG264_03350 [Streptomyces xanthophaeus]|uniref:hypothetical protein n=1 Tax=Streptomyces xanthophaeus TaxID=67385 RepID=UPI00386E2FF8|nr:hypothetical protein OG264_03350 [Streptomyces xanthophaeus]WST64395.1 hypothetical protein OG605_35010 [Streptomyces xanthophaeus]